MAEEKKQIKKNPNPLVVKGIFFVTAVFEDKRYVVSNGLSFLQFAKEGEDVKKGDYLRIHGPVYQRKDAANPIITGEAIVEKLTDEEVEKHKEAINKMFDSKPKEEKKSTTKNKATSKSDDHKMPWE